MVPLSGSDVSAQDIEQLLRTLGASPVYAGFTPAVTALQYVLADQQLLTSLTTRLYPKVAESCEIALPCVERNIRTMIAVIWEKNQFLFQIVVGYRRKTICRRLFSQPFHFSDVSSGQRLAGLSAIKKCYRKT